MFEIFVIVKLIMSGNQITFVSPQRFDTKVVCEAAVKPSYDQLNAHILSHMIEKFEVESGCRPVEEGA